MTAGCMRRWAGKSVWVLVCFFGAGLLGTAPVWAAGSACLTDSNRDNDVSQIFEARRQIAVQCPCAGFDGSFLTRKDYAKCVNTVIKAAVAAAELRKQCKGTLKTIATTSTCGFLDLLAEAPCVKKSLKNGKTTCTIRPAAKCVDKAGSYTQRACPRATTCLDAADTNGDVAIAEQDSGACNQIGCCAYATDSGAVCNDTSLSALIGPATCDGTWAPGGVCSCDASQGGCTGTCIAPNFFDNGDGTIIDNQTGLMWEKKDRAGGLHDVDAYFTWAGLCGCTTGSCTGSEPLCQPDATATAACTAQTGGAEGCALCSSGSCNLTPFAAAGVGAPTTIWSWLAQLNASNFAGHSDWRIPTVEENGEAAQLETLYSPPYPNCTRFPCVPAVFYTDCANGCGATNCSCTGGAYWSATTYAPARLSAWSVSFAAAPLPYATGNVFYGGKWYAWYVRAVRPGS